MPRESRVFIKYQPALQWGWSEVLQNKMVYYLETLVWQKGYDPKKKAQHLARRPKLFRPDFMPQVSAEGEISKGAEVHTTDEIDAILAKPRV